MATKQGVKELDSPNDDTEDKLPPDEGKSPSKSSDDRSELNKASEKLRKENETLKRQNEEFKAQLDERIAELEEKNKLTPSQEQELETLQDMKSKIRGAKEAKPWLEIIKEESKNGQTEIVQKIEYENAVDWVEDKAEELGLDSKDFEKELVSLFRSSGEWANASLKKKCKMAFKEWKAEKDRQKTFEEAKKREIQFSDRGKAAGVSGKKVDIDEALKSGDHKPLLDDLWDKATTRK